MFFVAVLLTACGGGTPTVSPFRPTPVPSFEGQVHISFDAASQDVTGGAGGGTPPGGSTEQPPPTAPSVKTTSGDLHDVLPASLGEQSLVRADLAGGDPDLARALNVSNTDIELASATTAAGQPIGWAYRVRGVEPQAILDVVATRFTPPGASPQSITVGDRGVLKLAAPIGSTYMVFSRDALVVLGGPLVTEADVDGLISQVP